jgi:hypothetical protein
LGVATLVAIAAVLGATFAFAGLVKRTKTVDISGVSKGHATAKCPKGRSVAVGGFKNTMAPGGNPEALLTGLQLAGRGRSWKDTGTNDRASTAQATSIAYCGRRRHLAEREKTVTVPAATLPTSKPTNATAKCPKGKRVALGGIAASFSPSFAPNAPAIWVSGMRRTTQRAWRVSGLNLGDGDGNLTSVVYCGKAPRTTERSRTVTIPSENTPGSVTAKCHRGEKLAFGGFEADVTEDDEFVLINGLRRTSGRKWKANANNEHTGSSAPGDLTALAYCS